MGSGKLPGGVPVIGSALGVAISLDWLTGKTPTDTQTPENSGDTNTTQDTPSPVPSQDDNPP